jgi:hypothetical protein
MMAGSDTSVFIACLPKENNPGPRNAHDGKTQFPVR